MKEIDYIGNVVKTASAGPSLKLRHMYEAARLSHTDRFCTLTLSSVAMYSPRICAHCNHKKISLTKNGGIGRLLRCTGCQVTWYCCPACRENDWPTHKKLCGKENEKGVVMYPMPENIVLAKAVSSSEKYPSRHCPASSEDVL